MKLDLDAIRKLIRTEEDAVILREKLTAMIEEAHPVAIFKIGEIMPMHEFLARYEKKVCRGVVPRFCSALVHVVGGNTEGMGALEVIISPPSANPKSKTCPEPSRRIENPKSTDGNGGGPGD